MSLILEALRRDRLRAAPRHERRRTARLEAVLSTLGYPLRNRRRFDRWRARLIFVLYGVGAALAGTGLWMVLAGSRQ